MNTSTMLKDLSLCMFSYDDKKSLFHNLSSPNFKKSFEFSSEFIKLVHYLQSHHIRFKEFSNGDIQIIK